MTTDQIAALGRDIADHLENGGTPVRVEYTPGNGTRYDLLFVQADGCVQFGDRMGADDSGAVFVSLIGWKGSTTYPFRIDHQIHASYIAEHLTGGRQTDAVAINLLFQAIAGIAPAQWWSQPVDAGVGQSLGARARRQAEGRMAADAARHGSDPAA